MTDARTDLDLVAAANAGAPAAFEALYHRHRDWVLRVALRLVGDQDRAFDVVQETFLYLLGKFPGFRLTAALRTFLYPAIKNLAIQRLRRDRRATSDDELLAGVPARTVAPGGNADLAAMIATLSPGHREVVLLRFVDGMELAEIAAALDIPLGTVKSRLHHALLKLHEDPRLRGLLE